MPDLRVRAEIEKLARLLGVDMDRLAYLEKLSAEDVRVLRERATDALFDADEHLFDRLSASSRVIPDALSATLSQKVFGPLFTARMTAAVPVATAVSVAKKLPHDFLADVAVLLDPRRASDVIARVPADHVAKTSRRLADREEWVTMGRFVGHLDPEALRATLKLLSPEAMLRIAFVIEDPATLPRVVEMLPDRRIEEVLRAAVERDLIEEGIALFGALSDDQRERVRAAAERLGPDEQLAPLVAHI